MADWTKLLRAAAPAGLKSSIKLESLLQEKE
jgi:hypothetical protein